MQAARLPSPQAHALDCLAHNRLKEMKTVNPTNRRVFMLTLAAGSSALASSAALAQAKLDEKDATAVALGYVADTKKADGKKYPKHDASQHCGNCQLFQGKAGAADGPCAHARHGAATSTTNSTMVATIRIKIMRLMANGVPWNRISGGRKSSTEGR